MGIGSCLGDLFSVSWMEDLDIETGTSETLDKQFRLVQAETNKSHVMRYSDLSFAGEPVSDFFGNGTGGLQATPPMELRPVSVRDLDLHQLEEAYRRAETSLERGAAGEALQAEIARQQAAEATFRLIAELAYPGNETKQQLARRIRETPENVDCEKGAHMALRSSCAHKFDASSGFAMQFQQVIVNICADVRRGLNLDVPAIAMQACAEGRASEIAV